jgi:hypothetical protein
MFDRTLLALALVATAAACTPVDDDSGNCSACAADSEEATACVDALRGCEETEDEDTPEEHEACESDANANCE